MPGSSVLALLAFEAGCELSPLPIPEETSLLSSISSSSSSSSPSVKIDSSISSSSEVFDFSIPERLYGRFAMITFDWIIVSYLLTGQIIPGLF